MATKKKATNTKGTPLQNGSGAGTGNAGRGGCPVPKATRKGRNSKK